MSMRMEFAVARVEYKISEVVSQLRRLNDNIEKIISSGINRSRGGHTFNLGDALRAEAERVESTGDGSSS